MSADFCSTQVAEKLLGQPLRPLCTGTISPETGVTILDANGEVFTPEAEAVLTEQDYRLATGEGMNWEPWDWKAVNPERTATLIADCTAAFGANDVAAADKALSELAAYDPTIYETHKRRFIL